MKKVVGVMLLIQLFSLVGLAQGLSSYCKTMSKDPKCWQVPNSQPQGSMYCPILNVCKRITRISFIQNERYYCEAGGAVECTDLVKKYGVTIIGAPVMVSFKQFDACHVPGACGPKACTPFHSVGIASLSMGCR
jgi:hypothetical protein